MPVEKLDFIAAEFLDVTAANRGGGLCQDFDIGVVEKCASVFVYRFGEKFLETAV